MLLDKKAGFSGYNGWPGLVRRVRGDLMSSDLRKGILVADKKCELCGHTSGLTYHTEEYGSLYEDFIGCARELCGVCHGLIHVRWQFRNRWFRHKQRIAAGKTDEVMKLDSIGQFFGVLKGLKDLPGTVPDVKTGIDWLDAITMDSWGDKPPKVALAKRPNGALQPDPRIYTMNHPVEGVAWLEGKLSPYSWSP